MNTLHNKMDKTCEWILTPLVQVIFFIQILVATLCWCIDAGATTQDLGQLESRVHNSQGRDKVDAIVELISEQRKSDPEKALSIAQTALLLAEQDNYIKGRSKVLHGIGTILERFEQFDQALEYYGESLAISEELGDQPQIALTLNNMGVVYQRAKRFSDAINNFHRAQLIFQQLEDKLGIAMVAQNLGVLYREQRKFPKALASFQKVALLSRELDNQYGLALANISIGYVYGKLGEGLIGLEFLNKGLKQFEAQQDIYSQTLSHIWIGETNSSISQYQNALDSFARAFELANQKAYTGLLIDIHFARSQLYEKMGRYKDALFEYQTYVQLLDALEATKMEKNVSELQIRFDSESKDREIQHLKENQVLHEKIRNIFILIILFFVFLLLVLVNWYNKRIKANDVIAARNFELQAIDQIVQSINREVDLQRILRTFIEQLRNIVTGTECAAFFLFDKTKSKYHLVSHFGYAVENETSELDSEQVKYWLNLGVAVGEHQEIRVHNLAGKSKDVVTVSPILLVQSSISMLIKHESEPLGFVVLGCMSAENCFDEDDALTLIKLRAHAVSAIKNAALHNELTEAATTDPLTGLANRRFATKLIDSEVVRVRRGSSSNFSLVLCDFDHFKKINDSYGHVTGDQMLVAVVDEISSIIREQDTLIRWGGEEFLILLPNTDEEGAKALSDKIRKQVAESKFHLDDVVLRLTLTMGISQYYRNSSIEHVLARADDALYWGKKNGRDQAVTASSIPN